MTAIKSPHSRVFIELAFEYRKALEDAVLAGMPGDYAAYRHLVGQLQGINDALRLSESADFKLSGDDHAGS